MADGSFPGLVSRNRDANAVANEIYVGVTDGTDQWLIDGSGNGNVILAANSGVDIGDVDVTSVVPGVGATNLGKAEDAVHGSGDTGVMSLAVRNDTLAALAGTDGDYAPFQVDADGALYVAIASGAGGTEYSEDAATPATIVGTATMMERDDALTAVTPIEGDWISFRGTAEGALWTQDFNSDAMAASLVDIETNTDYGAVIGGGVEATALRVTIASDSTGLLSVDDNGGSLTVDTGTLVDGAAGGTDNVFPAGAVRDDALSTLTPAEGDYVNLRTDSIGALWVRPIEEGTSGTEIQDYDTAAAVASDSTDNHDYTVANSTFLLKSVIVAGSGSIKAEIQTGPLASLTTKAVVFLTGRQGDTQQVFFDPAIEVPVTSTGTIRVIRTNRQGSAADVYSTIIGNDI
jgi:hypothetical protein